MTFDLRANLKGADTQYADAAAAKIQELRDLEEAEEARKFANSMTSHFFDFDINDCFEKVLGFKDNMNVSPEVA